MWAFRQAVWDRCDFDPTQILWILQLIYHPILLHRVLVWWEATNKTSHVTKVTKINRFTFMAATGAFKTRPTLAL